MSDILQKNYKSQWYHKLHTSTAPCLSLSPSFNVIGSNGHFFSSAVFCPSWDSSSASERVMFWFCSCQMGGVRAMTRRGTPQQVGLPRGSQVGRQRPNSGAQLWGYVVGHLCSSGSPFLQELWHQFLEAWRILAGWGILIAEGCFECHLHDSAFFLLVGPYFHPLLLNHTNHLWWYNQRDKYVFSGNYPKNIFKARHPKPSPGLQCDCC